MLIVLTSMFLTIVICALIAVISVAVVTEDPAAAKGLYYPPRARRCIPRGRNYLPHLLVFQHPAGSLREGRS